MSALSKHALGQMRHIDLLSLAFEAEALSDGSRMDPGSRSREQLIDALTRTGPLVRLAERAEKRLSP